MTTPELSAAPGAIPSDPPESGGLLAASGIRAARAAGALDPSLIAQLANQFFSALPGSAIAPAPKSSSFSPTLAAAPVAASPAPVASAVPHPSGAPAPITLSPNPEAPRRLPATAPEGASLPPSPSRLAAPPADGPVSSSGFYFIDEATIGGAAKTARKASPFWFDTFAVTQELAENHPNRAPDIGFASARPFDPRAVRDDFPILRERPDGKPLIWLDNAATTQKPRSVIDRLTHFYERENSNIHRGAHALATRATDAYEEAREKTRAFLNAESAEQIVFARG
ncbi:MAG: aminotransferase class V-fold PLP-dependent enzyme, partial [Candidatus Accumulibacter sp.]|nr:aminotransferase class V-fold PLP-dependent enzyme [Accumulibacter sp.]